MALPPRFLEELRDKVPLSTVIGRKVKLTRRGHEYTGLCPFHHEKTPSFTINDAKGFYHCFGCGAHGDIIKYLMDAEKMPFMEAVEHLAGMAGMKVPESSPAQLAQEKRRGDLTAIMEEACRFFQTQLFSMGGERGKNYLIRRGISGQVAKQFRLGYAPSGSALTAHFQAKGFDIKECMNLGLVARNTKTGQLHDYFYDRVMFPILDRRKRVIGFGGRMMEKGEPKYLNSPETALFHKGEQLYALPNAIETIRQKNEVILVEGYMDVIALHSAGFTNAVAPLGTALTEQQIKILWQSCDEPLICFDGDGAGRKASVRALNRALPILTPGKSLRFVFLPDPFDPDDMIRKKSPEAFAQLIKEARSFADVLWDTLTMAHPVDTPERMAKFEKDVRDTVALIQDTTVRGYYQKDFKDRLWKLTHGSKKGRVRLAGRRILPIHSPTPGLAEARMLLAYVLCYPQAAEPFIEDIATTRLPDKILNDALQEMAALILDMPEITSETVINSIQPDIMRLLSAEIEMLKRSDRETGEVSREIGRMLQQSRIQAIQTEIAQETERYLANPDPGVWENIKALKKEIEKLSESE